MKRIASLFILCGLFLTLFLFSCSDFSSTSSETEIAQLPSATVIRNKTDSLLSNKTFPVIQNSDHINSDDTLTINKNDTIRILKFFGHEVSYLPKNQQYWKVLKINEGLYKRVSTSLDSITSKYPGVLNSFRDEPVEFIYTGLYGCNETIKGDDPKKSMRDGDSMLVQQHEMSSVYMLYTNKQIRMVRSKKGTLTSDYLVVNFKDFSDYVQYFDGFTVHWIGDIDCDSLNEIFVRFEMGNTIYYLILKTQKDSNYTVVAKESLYWD